MNGRNRRRMCWLWCALFAAWGCRAEQPPNTSTQRKIPIVAAVNYPLAYFAERIGGPFIQVRFPAPADVDPDYWQPDAQAIQEFQNADLILLNGSDYARWTETVSLPDSHAVNTSAGFRDKYLKIQDAILHKHGPEGEHAHEGLATLTWLDPQQARAQARAVYQALAHRIPDKNYQLSNHWSTLDRELAELEQQLKTMPSSGGGLPKIWASHPVYDYLARFCNWDLRSMHWEPDETPDDEQWEKFAEQQRAHAASIMLWEAPPAAATQAKLAEFGVACVAYYPCGNRPQAGDYLSVMKENIARLREALESEQQPSR